MIPDCESEPARSLEARRAKSCVLKDVAGMLRSYQYAAETAWREASSQGPVAFRHADWQQWPLQAGEAFVAGYREAAGSASFLPSDDQFHDLLRLFVLDKAVYELRYELHNRPDWLSIPLAGLRQLLKETRGRS